ncbi:MAG: hypothetical protein LBR76_08430 [Oscillospiraceae bacterium]|nr:hypothetical protein [Oscillospiraceae bacterium]
MTDFQHRAVMAAGLDMLNKCGTAEDLGETKKTISKPCGDLTRPDSSGQ